MLHGVLNGKFMFMMCCMGVQVQGGVLNEVVNGEVYEEWCMGWMPRWMGKGCMVCKCKMCFRPHVKLMQSEHFILSQFVQYIENTFILIKVDASEMFSN